MAPDRRVDSTIVATVAAGQGRLCAKVLGHRRTRSRSSLDRHSGEGWIQCLARVSETIAWWHTGSMPRFFSRLSASIPDAITAAFYFTAWVAPTLLGPQWVRSLLAAIVIEFLVMHASALYG